ncbi:MAG: Y-family DNA polymerase [Parachlamydiaceae bacterium]|nr:Y-family DNA polymerase [Parachlamydiaceae bacterium]
MSSTPYKHVVLVDCDNFYVSCERLFNPSLNKRAVIVLSNNDGCVVARSQEAKMLGIKMGDPFFQIKQLCERLKVLVYSSNYSLYGDISQRIMHILGTMAEEIEIYSIDEAFLTFSSKSPEDLLNHCTEIRRIIKKWVGISVSIGIASTKTLAKVATSIAKKNGHGVALLNSDIENVLKKIPVEDVWGIGSSTKVKLHARSITTAWEFQKQDPSSIRKLLGVVGERMLWELKGRSCLPMEQVAAKKSIASSRSFGKVVTELTELAEALSTYVNTACAKLRQQGSSAQAICVYLELAIDYQSNEPYTGPRQHSTVMSFNSPTNDTPQIITASKSCLTYLYREGLRYKKCGVILLDLIPESQVSPDLFLKNPDKNRQTVAKVFDNLNKRFGKNTLFYGAMGVNPKWKMRSQKRSDGNSSSWDNMPIVKS